MFRVRSTSNYVQRLLAFLIDAKTEDPISILRDFIDLRQKESNTSLNQIITVGLCWKEIVDDKTLVRHFTFSD